MGDDVNSRTDLLGNHELITDLVRFSEQILTEQQIRRKYGHLDTDVWEHPDEKLIEAVEAEKIRRIRSGASAREKAQLLYATKVPETLDQILSDSTKPARVRVDSAREIRAMAAGSETSAAASTADKFLIVINLGDEVIRYPANDDKTNTLSDMSSKTIEHAHNVDADDTDTVPSELLATVAANKQGGSNSGQPL